MDMATVYQWAEYLELPVFFIVVGYFGYKITKAVKADIAKLPTQEGKLKRKVLYLSLLCIFVLLIGFAPRLIGTSLVWLDEESTRVVTEGERGLLSWLEKQLSAMGVGN